jgi:MFS family permease
MALAIGISASPAPLYGLYANEWHFAPITTTVVFSAYAAAALVSVLVVGSISDRFGRRRVLLAAVITLIAGLVVFMTAGGVAALLVARVLHGLAVGAIVVAGSAALLDLRPAEGAMTGKRTGVAFNVGITIAVLGTAVDAQYGPAPLVAPFAALAFLTALGLVAVLLMRESHRDGRAVALHIARPRVPAAIAADFGFAALGVMASWSVLGVFLSLVPGIASRAAGTDNLVFGGGVVAAMAAFAGVSQQLAVRIPAKRAAFVGDFGTAAALLLCVAAVDAGEPWGIVAAASTLGFFFGLAFGSSLRHLGQVVPAAHRGEVMSAFYVLAYLAMAVPTVLAGWAATTWSADSVFTPFMVAVAVACLLAGGLGLRVPRLEPDIVAS